MNNYTYVSSMKKLFTPGVRIRLESMSDPFAVPSGTLGTVDYVDDAGQIHMKWDNGSTLALIEGIDKFKIINICPICHKEYSGHPAISRKDNKTKICSSCGYSEAIEAFIKFSNSK